MLLKRKNENLYFSKQNCMNLFALLIKVCYTEEVARDENGHIKRKTIYTKIDNSGEKFNETIIEETVCERAT